MDQTLLIAGLIACVSLLYATAGQAGGTAFLAVMTFAAFTEAEMRPTALFLNVVAAGYATWRLHRSGLIDRQMLWQVTIPSMGSAFVGGLFILGGRVYFTMTGLLLVAAAALMVLRRQTDVSRTATINALPAAMVGAGAGLISGLTGVGGGVFLTPVLIALGWATPRGAAGISAPFILCNSALGFVGVLLAGQRLTTSVVPYAIGALGGAAIGTSIGLRWMTQNATRYILAAILLFAGVRMMLR